MLANAAATGHVADSPQIIVSEPTGRRLRRARDDQEVIEASKQAYLDAFEEASESAAPFDLVILDLTIVGGHDGLWTIEHLQRLDPDVKALVATGYNNAPVVADPEAQPSRCTCVSSSV